MLRLALLVTVAALLPAAGTKPAAVITASRATPVVSAAWAPHVHLPRLHFGGRKKNGNTELAQMNARLRALVGQEEAWYADHGVYGRSAPALAAQKRDDPTAASRVQVDILYAGKTGWTAVASHPDAPGKSCVVFVGVREKLPIVMRTRADGTDATLEGIPACDAK